MHTCSLPVGRTDGRRDRNNDPNHTMNAAAHCDFILTDERSLPGGKRGRDRWSSFLSFVQRKLWMDGFDCAFYHSTSCPKRVCRDPLFWLSSYSWVFGTRLSLLLFKLLHPWRIYFSIIQIVFSLSDHAVPLIWTFHWLRWGSFNGIAVHVLFILILFSVGWWISFRCDAIPFSFYIYRFFGHFYATFAAGEVLSKINFRNESIIVKMYVRCDQDI